MITRIVRLTLKDKTSQKDFRELYSKRNPMSRSVPGCLEVKIMKDTNENLVYYTVSKWSTNKALEDYRASAYFKETWPKVKSNLSAKTMAFTLEEVVE